MLSPVVPNLLRRAGRVCPLLLLMLLVSSSFFAGYKRLKVKVEPVASYPCRSTQNRLTIAADPYNEKEKLLTAFDLKKMLEQGIVPLHLILANEGEHVITVNGEAVQLLDEKNRPAYALGVEEVMQQLVHFSPRRTIGPRSPIPLPGTGGGKSAGDLFEIEADLTNKLLKMVRINPKSTQDGFVFFRVPPEAQPLKGYRVYLPELRDLTARQDLVFFEIELK